MGAFLLFGLQSIADSSQYIVYTFGQAIDDCWARTNRVSVFTLPKVDILCLNGTQVLILIIWSLWSFPQIVWPSGELSTKSKYKIYEPHAYLSLRVASRQKQHLTIASWVPFFLDRYWDIWQFTCILLLLRMLSIMTQTVRWSSVAREGAYTLARLRLGAHILKGAYLDRRE